MTEEPAPYPSRHAKADRIASRCLPSTLAGTLQYVIWHGMLLRRSPKRSQRRAPRCRIHSVAPLTLVCPASKAKTSRQRMSAQS